MSEIDDALKGIDEKRKVQEDGRFSPLGIADHFFAGNTPTSPLGENSNAKEKTLGWTLIFTDGDFIMAREPMCIFSPLTPGKFSNLFKKQTDYGVNIFRPPFPPQFEGAFSTVIIDGKLEGELARLLIRESISRLLGGSNRTVYLLGKDHIIMPSFTKGWEAGCSRNLLKASPVWGNDVTRTITEDGKVSWMINGDVYDPYNTSSKALSLFDPNMKPKMENYRPYVLPARACSAKPAPSPQPMTDCGVHNLFKDVPCRAPEECIVGLACARSLSRDTVARETVAIRGPAPKVLCRDLQSDLQSPATSSEPTPESQSKKPSQRGESCPIPTELKIVDIPDAVPSTPITFASFVHISQTDQFLNAFTKQLSLLYQRKVEIYTKTIKTLKEELRETRASMYLMQITESNTQAIKEAFPGYLTLQSSIKSIESIISRLRATQKEMDAEEVRRFTLPESHSATLSKKRAFEKIVSHPTKGIESIIGRHNIKDHIARMLYAFSKDYRSILKAFGSLALLGNAGIGKTSLMKVIGYALSKSGILVRNSFRIVTRRDMISQFHGGTAHQTRDILISSLEGVIGIDECHALISGGTLVQSDYGEESVSELVNFMDKYIGLSFVIVAGYTAPMMKKFFSQNEGLSRRFRNVFVLEDYTPKDLTLILIKQLHDLGGLCTEDVANVLFTLISRVIGERVVDEKGVPLFKNQAGDMLNLATKIHTAMLCQVDAVLDDLEQVEAKEQRMEESPRRAYSIPIIVNAFRDFTS